MAMKAKIINKKISAIKAETIEKSAINAEIKATASN